MKKTNVNVLPKPIINAFFLLGVISAVSMRLIIVFQHFNPIWARMAWYFGVMGYIIFFLYRFSITNKRKKVIRSHDLISKLNTDACLDEEDRKAALYLLNSLDKSKEKYNYAVIFILSAVAIAVDLILSLSGS